MTSDTNELQVREKTEVDPADGETTYEGEFYRPDCDIYSDEAAIVMLMDVPGAGPEGLDIDLRERVLTLTAQVPAAPEGFRPISAEFRVGGFQRRFTLTDEIDLDGIEAKLKDGVLMLRLPRAKEALPRKINVSVG